MYFKNFPLIDYPYYNIDKKRILKSATNVTLRAKFSEYMKIYKTNFSDYTITDTERPDTLANRLYERPDLHWVFYIVNDIINPYYSWPMSNADLQSFINEKYQGSSFYAPDIWKDKNTYDLFRGTLEQLDQSTTFESLEIKSKYINTLKKDDVVKVSFNGAFFETTVIDVNSKIYEIALERKLWDLNSGSQRYIYYEVDIFGIEYCIRIPITRVINYRRYSPQRFQYISEYRDPQMIFQDGITTYDNSPYNFFAFPFTPESLGDGKFANSQEINRSFADVFAIEDDDGNYMDSSYYVTNEQYESDLNESKRKILVPKPQVVESVLKQIKEIFIG